MRRIAVLLIALAALGMLCWAGLEAARGLAPARLRAEVEGLLVRATHGPVEIADLRLVWGLPIHLDAGGLRLYDGALTVESVRARIDVLSLFTGRPRLTRIQLAGAELRLTQSRDGSWKPRFGDPDKPRKKGEASLAALRTSAGLARFLLARPFLADAVAVEDGRLSVTAAGAKRGATSLRLEGLRGELQHSRLLGSASLELAGRWVEGRSERGALTWKGTRGRDGRVALTLTASALDLSALAPGLRALVPGLELRGRLDGVAEFEGAAPDRDRFVLAVTARDLEARAGESEDSEWLRVPRLAANARFALDPKRLALSDGLLEIGEWHLALDASFSRPLGAQSLTQGRIAIEGLQLDPQVAYTLTGFLPPSLHEQARELVARVREGRLLRGELAGEAPLEQWGEALAGRVEPLLPALEVAAELEGVKFALDPESALENVSGRLEWSAGDLQVHGARALLDGEPLPVLDVRFRGLAQLLASTDQERAMESSAQTLPGVTPLHALFQSPSGAPSKPAPTVHLELEHLHHRALLWPMREIEAGVLPHENGLHVAIQRALWAGVPIEGEAEWTPRPERRLAVQLEARAPEAPLPGSFEPAPPAATAPVTDPEAWAKGRIELGPSQGGIHQRRTGARLRAVGADVRFDDVRCELDPSGEITGSLALDLSREDAVPYVLDAKLRGGDLGALIAQRGVTSEPMTGVLDLGGHLEGTLVPGRALFHDASGALSMAARDGTIPKTVPPVLALALASDSLNPFASRERIRYGRAEAELRFAFGSVSTQALEIEGPDLRMFAEGEIDLREKPNRLRAEIALFLFRQLDWALVKIPILNELLLGENKNLVAAYFRLVGTWQEPVAHAQPLRTMKDTAGGDILEGIPRVVIQGVKAIGGLLLPGAPAPPTDTDAPPTDADAPPTDADAGAAAGAGADASPGAVPGEPPAGS